MKKHAYLILAHNSFSILKKLIILLDSRYNDIYIHIDKKVSFDLALFQNLVKESNIYIINSVEVYWADYSMIDATLQLLKIANKNGPYSYYHLISGVDMPLKSNEERYKFFENSGNKEFIGIVPNEVYYSVRRVKFYHILLHNKYYRNSKILKIFDRIFEYLQKFICINRLKNNSWKIVDGWQWFSITNDFCEYVINNEKIINKMFKYSISCDELVFQTLIYNSDFYKNIYDQKDLKNGSMRYIDWERGTPYTWGSDEEDYDLLISSPYMFARKFDEKNIELVDRIFEEIDRRNKNDK